jgi:hypothetical protein
VPLGNAVYIIGALAVAAGFGFTRASYFELGDEAARAVAKVAFG